MEAVIVIDKSTPMVIAGTYQFDRDIGGVLIVPSGNSFPLDPQAQELFWRKDEKKLYRRTDGNTAWESVLMDLPTVPVMVKEMHKVTAGEESQGYFTLAYTPTDPSSVLVVMYKGSEQINKLLVGSTGAIPDFEVSSGNQLHINGNGGATGLTGDIKTDSVVDITYTVAVTP